MTKERRLGRGLAALLGDDLEPVSLSQAATAQPPLPRISEPDEDERYDGTTERSDGPIMKHARSPCRPNRPRLRTAICCC